MDAKLCAVFRPFTDTGVFSHGHLAALLGSALIVSAALHPPASAQSANDGSWVWTARGHASAPSPRSGVSAVWTGSKMLIWGGQLTGSSTYLNQGYRYEVQTDSWSPMSAKNAPVARYFHTAIWTGRELIIWGGGTDDTGGQGPACLNTRSPL